MQIRLAAWSNEGQSLSRLVPAVVPEAPAVARHDGFANPHHHFPVLGADRAPCFQLKADVETWISNPSGYLVRISLLLRVIRR